jgi:hypothetical protein
MDKVVRIYAYFLNDKDVGEKEIAGALENLLSRKFIDGTEGPIKMVSEMKRVVEKGSEIGYRQGLIKDAQAIVDLDWFKQTYSQSPQLSEFYELYKALKSPSAAQPAQVQTQTHSQ